MKKIYKIALMFIAVISAVVFSACGNKYSKLQMGFYDVDGNWLESVRLIFDEEQDKYTQRVAVKVSGIKQKDIGELAVYSSPTERVLVADYKYDGDTCYVTITANVAGAGELVVTHLASNIKHSIPLSVEQKSTDINLINKNYVVAIPENGTNSHTLEVDKILSLYPANSSDNVMFTLGVNQSVAEGVELQTVEIDNIKYITGFNVSPGVNPFTLTLQPVTILDGYDHTIYSEEADAVTIHFIKTLNSSNFELTSYANDLLKTGIDTEPLYDLTKTTYLVAKDSNDMYITYKNQTNENERHKVGSYNSLKLNLNHTYTYYDEITFEEKIGYNNISDFLPYYNVYLPNEYNEIQSDVVLDNQVVIQAKSITERAVDVRIIMQPKEEFVGQIYSVEKFVSIQGVAKAETIEVEKADTILQPVADKGTTDPHFKKALNAYYETDLYDFYSATGGDGALYNFSAITKSNTPVFEDFKNIRIAIAPQALYTNRNLYYNEEDFANSNKAQELLDGVPTSTQKYLIKITEYGSLLKFRYDGNYEIAGSWGDTSTGLLISEPITSLDNIYIKYEMNVQGTETLQDFGIYILTDNNSVTAGRKYLEHIDNTVVRIDFNRNNAISDLSLKAGVYEILSGTRADEFIESTEDITNVYLNRADGITANSGKLLRIVEVKGKNQVLSEATINIEVVPENENCTNPLKIRIGGTEYTEIKNYEYKTSAGELNNIDLIFDSTTSIGMYQIKFSQTDDVGNVLFNDKVVYARVYQDITADDISFEIDEKQHIINNQAGVFSEYTADYIVGSGEKFDVNISLSEASLQILKGYTYSFGYETVNDVLMVDNGGVLASTSYKASDYMSIANIEQKDNVHKNNATELTALAGTYLDVAGVYTPTYVVLKIGAVSESYNNIITASGEKTIYKYIKFFIYEKIKDEDISINHTDLNKYMYGSLGYYYEDMFSETLTVSLSDGLWNYVQEKTQSIENNNVGISGYSAKVTWVVTGEDENKYLSTDGQADKSISLTFGDAGAGRNSYSRRVTAVVHQFNTVHTLDCVINVARPKATTYLTLNSELSEAGTIELKQGEKYTVDITKFSTEGYATIEDIIILMVTASGVDETNKYATLDGNTITINEVPTGATGYRLLVLAKDVVNTEINSGMSGFRKGESIKNLLIAGCKNAYLDLDLTLIDGKSIPTAFKIYNEDDFWKLNEAENKEAYFELMKDITINNTSKTIAGFSGVLFSTNEQFTIYGTTLTKDQPNLFTGFTGSICNVGFEVNYAVNIDQVVSGRTLNIGIIDKVEKTAGGKEILINVSVILRGNISIGNLASAGGGLVYVGGLTAVNLGDIIYAKNPTVLNADYAIYEPILASGKVSGTTGSVTISGNEKVYFGGLVGCNEGLIEGYENPVSEVLPAFSNNIGTVSTVADIDFMSAGSESGKLSSATITATNLTNINSAVGGVVGLNLKTINNGWADGKVIGVNNVGGVVGENSVANSTELTIDYQDTGIETVSFTEQYSLVNVKSSAIVEGTNNVGGVVGKDINGLYYHTYYQAVKKGNDYNYISGATNVGGIAGLSSNGIFHYCSVMSYKYDYSQIIYTDPDKKAEDIEKNKAIFDGKTADIYGNNYVGGLVGYAKSTFGGSLNADDDNFTTQVAILYSSVNAYVKAENTTDAEAGAILSNGSGKAVIFNAYFLGKFEEKVKGEENLYYHQVNTTYTCLDNNGLSFVNNVYSINVNYDLINGTSFNIFGGFDGDSANSIFVIMPDSNTYLNASWSVNPNVNNGKPFIVLSGTNNPNFEVAPSKLEINIINNRINENSLYLEYYSFNNIALDLGVLSKLNTIYNLLSVTDYLEFAVYPTASQLSLYTTSSNPSVVEINSDGKFVINGIGESVITFSPVLNTEIKVELNVYVVAPKGDLVISDRFDATTSINALGIAKNKSKIVYINAFGQVEEDVNQYVSGDEIYSFNANDKVNLKVEITPDKDLASGTVADYLSISGTYNTTDNCYYVKYDELFSIKVLKYEEGLTFTLKVTPYLSFEVPQADGTKIEVDKPHTAFDEITLSLNEGATAVNLSQDFAYIYPNDETYITAYISTDILLDKEALDNDSVSDLISIYGYGSGYGDYATLTLIPYTTDEWKKTFNATTRIQTVQYKIEVDKTKFINKTEAVTINVSFEVKINGNTSTVEYIILPQRINYIEMKNYIQNADSEEVKLTQTDVLRPASSEKTNGGIIAIDIAPDNGYFDYLEIRDITGNEEIKFIQVEKVYNGTLYTGWKVVNDVDTPTTDGLGIKLEKTGGTIYVLTQIDKSYTTKPHFVKVSAHLNLSDEVIAENTITIQVKMLPSIVAEYILPDSTVGGTVDSADTILPMKLKLANGTSAELRITSYNANQDITHTITINDGANDVTCDYYALTRVGETNFYAFELAKPLDDSMLGKVITLTLKTAFKAENGDYEETQAKIQFTIVNYVIHSVSLTNASNGKITGNIDVPTELEFYFKKTDVSFYGNNEDIRYDKGNVNISTTLDKLNNILRVLNTNKYIDYNATTIDEDDTLELALKDPVFTKLENNNKVTLSLSGEGVGWTLNVQNGYNIEGKESSNLVLNLPLVYNASYDLTIPLKCETSTSEWIWILDTDDYDPNEDVFEEEYTLDFSLISSRIKPKVILTEAEFRDMKTGAGNYYMLGADIDLSEYVPIDINVPEFDGNGRTITIKSFKIFEEATINAGLFKQIYAGMIVKNLVVKYNFGETIDLCENPTQSVNYSSATFGGITAVNNGIITNCVVTGSLDVKATTIANNKKQDATDAYSIAFNIGGLVGENTSTGYITNSTAKLEIKAQANIGGFAYKNAGKIISCLAEEAIIDAYPQPEMNDKTIVTKVAGFVVLNESGTSNTFTGKTTGEISMCGVEYLSTTLSAKDLSTGFVWQNGGRIYDCYVEMARLGDTSNTFSGFVNLNNGTIATSYTYINKGKSSNNINMFAPGGTLNLTNCIEVVDAETGYNHYIESGLRTISLANRNNRAVYESEDFAFGDNVSAVWILQSGSLPRLVSVEDNLKVKDYTQELQGLRTIYQGESTNPEFEFEYYVNDGTYGNKDNPYIIATLDDWNYYVTADSKKYYRIVADIDFSSYGRNPLTSTYTFKGNIQGNNMCLSGIMLYSETALEAIGLFKTLESANDVSVKNSIRNLTLRPSSVWAAKSQTVGLLAGISQDFNLYNIHVDKIGDIFVGGNAVGGVVGLVRGNIDVQRISSNVGANATRATSQLKYSVYASYNNDRSLGVSYNLPKVYYAGSIFGVVDGYDKSIYRVTDVRDISKNYFNVRDLTVTGSVTIVGDTVGVAVGFVGERVKVQDICTTLTQTSLGGVQYSGGAVGENRGIIDGSVVVIEGDETFNQTTFVSAGLVGLNLGGLVQNSRVTGNILRTGNSTISAGIVGRNVGGSVVNNSFDGQLNAYYVGGIIGTDYKYNTMATWTSAGAFTDDCRNDKIIPKQDISYINGGTAISQFAGNRISVNTLNNFLAKIRMYYTFNNASDFDKMVSGYYVYGLFIGLADSDTDSSDKLIIENYVSAVGVDSKKEWLVFNGNYYADTMGSALVKPENGYLIKAEETDELKADTPFVNVIKGLLPADLKNYYIITYLVGSRATGFDYWGNEYSDEILMLTEQPITNEIKATDLNSYVTYKGSVSDEILGTKVISYEIKINSEGENKTITLDYTKFGFEDTTDKKITVDDKTNTATEITTTTVSLKVVGSTNPTLQWQGKDSSNNDATEIGRSIVVEFTGKIGTHKVTYSFKIFF